MEPIHLLRSSSERKQQFGAWLDQFCPDAIVKMTPLPGDASFRYYSRIWTAKDSYIAMDAPLAQDNIKPFIAIAAVLQELGLKTPTIYAADDQNGFMLLADFGDMTYLKALRTENADRLYAAALQALAQIQTCVGPCDLKLQTFGADWMKQEWLWHKEWFLNQYLNRQEKIPAPVEEAMEHLIAEIDKQPKVFMHRDYHSANLMVLNTTDTQTIHQIGLLDFQDAFIGPITYDLASLLRDCYIDWPEDKINEWTLQYWQLIAGRNEMSGIDYPTFKRMFDWMSVQRHLKALFTFARKAVRDQQPKYLTYVPRTLNYLIQVCSIYTELKPLALFLINDEFLRKQSCVQ